MGGKEGGEAEEEPGDPEIRRCEDNAANGKKLADLDLELELPEHIVAAPERCGTHVCSRFPRPGALGTHAFSRVSRPGACGTHVFSLCPALGR